MNKQGNQNETVENTKTDDNKEYFEEYDESVARSKEHAHDPEEECIVFCRNIRQ